MSTDIAILMATSPLKHTDADVAAIIAKYRSAASVFKTGALVKAEKVKKSFAQVVDLDLGDL